MNVNRGEKSDIRYQLVYWLVYWLYNASDGIGYGRRRTELSNALPHTKQDSTSIEKKTELSISILDLYLDIDRHRQT